MTYTKRRTETDSKIVIITPAGNVVRMTDGEAFVTHSPEFAEEALDYLTQTVAPGDKRRGTNRMKSMFGVFG